MGWVRGALRWGGWQRQRKLKQITKLQQFCLTATRAGNTPLGIPFYNSRYGPTAGRPEATSVLAYPSSTVVVYFFDGFMATDGKTVSYGRQHEIQNMQP